MKNIIKYTILFLSALIFSACPDKDQVVDSEVIIYNNSNIDINYALQYNHPLDTSLQLLHVVHPSSAEDHIVKSNSSDSLKGPFKSLFSELDNKIMMVYIFSKDTIDNIPWEEIVDQKLVLKRYDLTFDDLEDLDWTITYP